MVGRPLKKTMETIVEVVPEYQNGLQHKTLTIFDEQLQLVLDSEALSSETFSDNDRWTTVKQEQLEEDDILVSEVHNEDSCYVFEEIENAFSVENNIENKMEISPSNSKLILHPSAKKTKREFLRCARKSMRCFLCPKNLYKRRDDLEDHFKRVHLRGCLKCGGFIIAKCCLDCRLDPHFHCPILTCNFSCSTQRRTLVHFKLNHSESSSCDDLPEKIIIKEEVEEHEVTSIGNNYEEFNEELFGVAETICDHKTIALQSSEISVNKLENRKFSYANDADFPAPQKFFPFKGVPYNPHDSVSESAEHLFYRLCLPFCYLCQERKPFTAMSRLERHFRMTHLNRAYDCGSCYLVLCGLACMEGASASKKHYHCPYCNVKDTRRCAFLIHLENHRRDNFGSKSNTKSNKRDKGVNNSIEVDAHTMSNGVVETSEVCFETPRHENQIDSLSPPHPSGYVEFSPVFPDKNKNKAPPQIPWNKTYKGWNVLKIPSLNVSASDALSCVFLPSCYLCNDDKDHISYKRLIAHFTKCHIKTALTMDSVVILLCKRYCGVKHKDFGHYHCLFCPFVCRQKQRVEVHIEKHIRNQDKKTRTAEQNLPDTVEDHRVPDEWLRTGSKDSVRKWETDFNKFVSLNYDKKVKTNNNVLTERKKWLIYYHTKYGMDIEDKGLKYWTKFRGAKVIDCPQLNLKNQLVLPNTKYPNDPENQDRVIQQDPLQNKNFEVILCSSNPWKEFLDTYRMVATQETIFKILYRMHVMDNDHPAPKHMFAEVWIQYKYKTLLILANKNRLFSYKICKHNI